MVDAVTIKLTKLHIMKRTLKLLKIGKRTSNDNVILTLADEAIIDLGFAKKKKSIKYNLAIDADEEITSEVGEEIEIDFSHFEVKQRVNHVEDPETGQVVELMSNWLHFKA